jgi:hypothetical protein
VLQPREIMLLTTESTAWAVTFTAGLTAGVILGFEVTPLSLAKVSLIALLAVFACTKLLRSLRAERVA